MPTDKPQTPSHAKATHEEYALGSTDQERQRLMRQASIFRGFTETLFRSVGIGPRMRVLDLGSGVGDVAFLASDLVGTDGSVVGIDRDADNVAWATKRVEQDKRLNIRFVETEFADFTDPQPFDALVGRFILMYLEDPAIILKLLSKHLRQGAPVAFFEPDYSCLTTCVPDVPLIRQCEEMQREVYRRSGARPDIGMHLYHIFRDAGFEHATTSACHFSGCGMSMPLIQLFVETIRSVVPKIVQFGIATEEQVGIDTLVGRITKQGNALDPQWVSVRYIAASARKA